MKKFKITVTPKNGNELVSLDEVGDDEESVDYATELAEQVSDDGFYVNLTDCEVSHIVFVDNISSISVEDTSKVIQL